MAQRHGRSDQEALRQSGICRPARPKAFVPLNIDGEALPNDWYLCLAGEGGKMLRGEIPLTSTRPINP